MCVINAAALSRVAQPAQSAAAAAAAAAKDVQGNDTHLLLNSMHS